MLNILLSFHHIKFTDGKNEIYFKILFKRCRGMPLQGHLLAARELYDLIESYCIKPTKKIIYAKRSPPGGSISHVKSFTALLQ